MKSILALLIVLSSVSITKADEGMWMLPFIEKYNIQKMQQMGCKLNANEIFSENDISLKDAVVVFGNGCTGVMVSSKGLLFTNHHCGFGAIQQLSTVNNNYLRDGFVAEKLEDELPAKNLTVRFLTNISDVSERVKAKLPNSEFDENYGKIRDSIFNVIKKEYEDSSIFSASVKTFYSRNEFYVFVYEEFRDIRLAYTPTSSIGKFGGDTDNWMWPRHTGDFSVFRVYADNNGKPAKYSKENVPYTPKRFARISTSGYQPDDYTMILGNPGSTNRNLCSWGISNRMKSANQSKIDIRGVKQAVWKSFMTKDEAINIAYASKYARSSNYWKNSIGMNNAIVKLGIIEKKKEEEKLFSEWALKTNDRKLKYGDALINLESAYNKILPISHNLNYLRESLSNGAELPQLANQVSNQIASNIATDSIINNAYALYKDYFEKVDKATLILMLAEYKKASKENALPTLYSTIDKKYKGDYTKYVEKLFEKSAFSNVDKLARLLRKNRVSTATDPAVLLYNQITEAINKLQSEEYNKLLKQISNAEQLYEAGLKEIALEKGTPRYPDANSTMRLTYGKVGGYSPADAIKYNYYTTTDGILQKEIPLDREFDVPVALKKAILDKDFGTYVDANTGKLHVAFLSDNDITGGNSGSPIFNAKGELLGLAFDGNWEAMSGDIVFEPKLQRTINVDVRYMLFIMDKVSGANRLVEELNAN